MSVAEVFYTMWNFPMCIRALNGKHVKIQPPPSTGSEYLNYKGNFSLVLLAVADAHLRFIYVDVGPNGHVRK